MRNRKTAKKGVENEVLRLFIKKHQTHQKTSMQKQSRTKEKGNVNTQLLPWGKGCIHNGANAKNTCLQVHRRFA